VKTPEQQQTIKAAWNLANKPKQIGVEILCSGCARQLDLNDVVRSDKAIYCRGCPYLKDNPKPWRKQK
jgi:predicted Fe-S protein YdhL (DUF1289 family)